MVRSFRLQNAPCGRSRAAGVLERACALEREALGRPSCRSRSLFSIAPLIRSLRTDASCPTRRAAALLDGRDHLPATLFSQASRGVARPSPARFRLRDADCRTERRVVGRQGAGPRASGARRCGEGPRGHEDTAARGEGCGRGTLWFRAGPWAVQRLASTQSLSWPEGSAGNSWGCNPWTRALGLVPAGGVIGRCSAAREKPRCAPYTGDTSRFSCLRAFRIDGQVRWKKECSHEPPCL